MTSLKLLSDGSVDQVWTMSAPSTIVGRDRRQCDVVLAEASVSRVHAEIAQVEDQFFLIDRESRAGTVLNGCRLLPNKRYPLQPNDEIRICQFVLHVITDSQDGDFPRDASTDDSVTEWIYGLRDEDADRAQEQLWNRYFRRLVGYSRLKLGSGPRGVEDEEDVAIQALRRFFDAAREGRFPELKDRHGLWQLLARITARQAVNQRKKVSALKRGGGRVLTESVFMNPGEAIDARGGIAEVVGNEPSPEFLTQMSEQCRVLFEKLPDELKQIARLKLEGYTNAEIGEEIGKVERTVERKLQEIRNIWSE